MELPEDEVVCLGDANLPTRLAKITLVAISRQRRCV